MIVNDDADSHENTQAIGDNSDVNRGRFEWNPDDDDNN
jgi:hypothetical protein